MEGECIFLEGRKGVGGFVGEKSSSKEGREGAGKGWTRRRDAFQLSPDWEVTCIQLPVYTEDTLDYGVYYILIYNALHSYNEYI